LIDSSCKQTVTLNTTMQKHGLCPYSQKRNFGKGRKNKPTLLTKKCLGSFWMEDETTVHARNYRTRNQASLYGMTAPSRKRVKGNRRRFRRNTRTTAKKVYGELKQEKQAKIHQVDKMKKLHANQTRQMQKRFIRDIQLLWTHQAENLLSLKNTI